MMSGKPEFSNLKLTTEYWLIKRGVHTRSTLETFEINVGKEQTIYHQVTGEKTVAFHHALSKFIGDPYEPPALNALFGNKTIESVGYDTLVGQMDRACDVPIMDVLSFLGWLPTHPNRPVVVEVGDEDQAEKIALAWGGMAVMHQNKHCVSIGEQPIEQMSYLASDIYRRVKDASVVTPPDVYIEPTVSKSTVAVSGEPKGWPKEGIPDYATVMQLTPYQIFTAIGGKFTAYDRATQRIILNGGLDTHMTDLVASKQRPYGGLVNPLHLDGNHHSWDDVLPYVIKKLEGLVSGQTVTRQHAACVLLRYQGQVTPDEQGLRFQNQ